MTGHGYVRPGQVAPDLPPPDACVRCGQPEAAHRGAGLAEAVAARAMLADFRRISYEYTVGTLAEPDWFSLALRLGQHLELLLNAIGSAE